MSTLDHDTLWRAALLAAVQNIDRSLEALAGAARALTPAAAIAATPTEDLDLPAADELVKMKPRDWTGEDFKGTRMSLCPPAFLEQLAEVYDYFATKNDQAGAVDAQGRPKSFYDLRTARRARAWATRLRNHPTLEAPATPLPFTEINWSKRW